MVVVDCVVVPVEGSWVVVVERVVVAPEGSWVVVVVVVPPEPSGATVVVLELPGGGTGGGNNGGVVVVVVVVVLPSGFTVESVLEPCANATEVRTKPAMRTSALASVARPRMDLFISTS